MPDSCPLLKGASVPPDAWCALASTVAGAGPSGGPWFRVIHGRPRPSLGGQGFRPDRLVVATGGVALRDHLERDVPLVELVL